MQNKYLIEKQEIVDVFRIGKYIIIKFANEKYLLIHLIMTGQFFYQPKEGIKHAKFCFLINEKEKLFLSDIRKFLKIFILEDLNNYKGFDLGVDIFSKKFTLENFSSSIAKSKKNIYLRLLDQKIISGLGNIYVNESLFEAKIYPLSKNLTKKQIETLFKAIKKITQKALENFGTTFSNYILPNGKKGKYQNFLKVYKKDFVNGQQKVKRIKINGRSVFFCPEIQKEN